MQFEELIKKPIEDMTDDELDEVARGMDINQLKVLEKKIKKAGKRKVQTSKKKQQAADDLDALLAKGLS